MESHYARINDEELAILRKRIGIEVQRQQPHIERISKDAIRHFVYGIGDTNPLWTDEEYARKSRYKTIIAPPCILYSTDLIASGNVGGLPGVHAMFAGTNWEWFLPVKLGDHIIGSSYLSRLEEKRSEFAGRTFLQGYETVFRNQAQEIVARAESFCIRSERDTAREKGKYKAITRQSYTDEQLKAIETDYDREEVRGAQPRYWEEVDCGDELTPIVKGPLTITDMLAWLMGWGDAAFPDRVGGFFQVYVLAPLLGGVVAALFFVRILEPAMKHLSERCDCEADKTNSTKGETL